MTALEPLPFGAESPDELMAAYANGSLDPEARHEVERWLAVHPEWQPRLDAFRAVAGAVRRSAASSGAPDLATMAGLWSTIDSHPQPRPLRSAAPPPPPPPPPPYVPTQQPPSRWRSQPLLLAVAAALLVAVAATSVVLAVARGASSDDVAIRDVAPNTTDAPAGAEEDDATSAAPPPATGGGEEPEATASPPADAEAESRQELRDGAEATENSQTALTNLYAVGTLDLTGTSIEGVANTDTVTVTVAGTGSVDFPDRSQLDSETTIEGGLLSAPPEQASEIEVEGRKWVSCAGGAYVEQVEGGAEPECTALDLGASFATPEATLELLEKAEGDIENLGVEVVGGVDTTHYRFTSSFDGEELGAVPMTVEAWLGVEDKLLRQVSATTEFELPIDLFGETVSLPTVLQLTFALDDFGAPVDIQPPA